MEPNDDGVAVIYRCGSCDCVGLRGGMKDVQDAHQRFEPGDTYTDAECPKCAALAFPEDVPVKEHQHRWSGWPGAFCLKCGAGHALETAVADGVYDPLTNTWSDEEYRQKVHDCDYLCAISDDHYKNVIEPERHDRLKKEREKEDNANENKKDK